MDLLKFQGGAAEEKEEKGVICKVEADGLKVRQISEPLLRREEMLVIPFFPKKHCQDDDSSWIMEDGESEKSTASEREDTKVNETIIMNVN